MDETKLLSFISSQIKQLESKIIEANQADKKELEDLAKVLSKKDNKLELINNILTILIQKYPDSLNEKELQELNVFKIMLESGLDVLELTPQNINKIESYSSKLFSEINKQIGTLNESEQEDKQNTSKLSEIRRKILTKQELVDPEEFEWFLNYIDQPNLSYKEKSELISILGNIEITLYNEFLDELKSNDITILEEDVLSPEEETGDLEYIELVQENEINISEEELIKLFNKYGYDFNSLKNKEKKSIQEFGNIENIENIFKIFQDWKIGTDIFNNKSKQLVNILIGSTPDIVNSIIQNIKIDFDTKKGVKEYTFEEILSKYLLISSNWLAQTKQFVKKNQSPPTPSSDKVAGTFKNYEENRLFFSSLGLNMNDIMWTCPSISCNNPKALKYRVKCFDFYGIPKKTYFNKLSALSKKNPLDIIDRYIELGHYEYISKYLSTICRSGLDGSVFYRIKQANLQSKSIYSDKKGHTEQLNPIITSPNFNTSDPSDKVIIMKDGKPYNNGPSAVGEFNYLKSSPAIESFYEKAEPIVRLSQNIGPINKALKDPMIRHLEMNFSSSKNPKTYNINGVLISRLKVLRIYETLLQNNLGTTKESLEYSIFRNSILTEREVNKVIEAIKPITKITKYERRR